jgi:DNA polymerase (family X)
MITVSECYPVYIEKLIDYAVDTSTALEINVHYNCLDLKGQYIRLAVEKDVN